MTRLAASAAATDRRDCPLSWRILDGADDAPLGEQVLQALLRSTGVNQPDPWSALGEDGSGARVTAVEKGTLAGLVAKAVHRRSDLALGRQRRRVRSSVTRDTGVSVAGESTPAGCVGVQPARRWLPERRRRAPRMLRVFLPGVACASSRTHLKLVLWPLDLSTVVIHYHHRPRRTVMREVGGVHVPGMSAFERIGTKPP